MALTEINEVDEPRAALGAKLASLRARLWAVRAGTGLALAVVAGVELLGLALFLDWWVELPWTARLLLLLVQAAIELTLVVRFVILPRWRQPDDEAVALLVERAKPVFAQRLIAAVQLTQPLGLVPGASPALARATVEEAERIARSMDFREIAPAGRARRLGWLALGVLVAGLAALIAGGATTMDLLRRAFLSTAPVPRKTRVLVENANRIVGRGDDVRLAALASGVIPSKGKVELRMPGRRPQRFVMAPESENPKRFARLLENVQDGFDYVVYLNDARSGPHTVEVRPRPAVRSIKAVQEFPAYTGLGQTPRMMSDLSLLAGSRLRLSLEATLPVRTGQIRLVGTRESAAMQVDMSNPAHLNGTFLVPTGGLTGFAIHMVDTRGMGSEEGVVYPVQVLPDRPPEVLLTYPERKEELVTRGAKLLIGMAASDDFAVASLRLRYRASPDAGAEASGAIELDLGQERPRRVERRFNWDLGRIIPPPGEGALLEYWVEGQDNNNATGPGVGQSEHRAARVVSESEKRADLLNRAGDIFSGITDATEDQEQLNRRLGEIILEKTGP